MPNVNEVQPDNPDQPDTGQQGSSSAGAGAAYTPQPGFLTAAQLASIQKVVLITLPWVCVIKRKTLAPDGFGDQTESWSTVQVTNCDVEMMTSKGETPVGDQLRSDASYLITLPWNAQVEANDQLVVNGTTYEVQNRFTNWTDQSAVYVTAEEVK